MDMTFCFLVPKDLWFIWLSNLSILSFEWRLLQKGVVHTKLDTKYLVVNTKLDTKYHVVYTKLDTKYHVVHTKLDTK